MPVHREFRYVLRVARIMRPYVFDDDNILKAQDITVDNTWGKMSAHLYSSAKLLALADCPCDCRPQPRSLQPARSHAKLTD